MAWYHVAKALDEVPRLFQLWACKQVLGIASTNGTVSKWDNSIEPTCPSCRQCTETTSHILSCDEVGRVEVLGQTIDMLECWLHKMGTDPVLTDCLVEFARGRDVVRMTDICRHKSDRYQRMARSQDLIGWRQFLEGMISRRVIELQQEYLQMKGLEWKLDKWASGLVVRLLEITHGQWLYRNVVVHDATAGRLAVVRKEKILAEIEEQQSKGESGLLEEHKYLLEVNLDDIGELDGTSHEYWLLAIQAARVACATIGEEEEQGTVRGHTRSITQQLHQHDGLDYC